MLVTPAYSVRADKNQLSNVSKRVLHSDSYSDAFFSIQVPVSKSFLAPIKLFFEHVLLSSKTQLLQYSSQSHLILHLMHLQLYNDWDYNHFLRVPHSCDLDFKHFLFFNLSYFPFIHLFICRYGNIYGFLFGFINNNNIWSSSFNIGIRLDCKIPQNLVPFVLNNSIWLMLVLLLCSLEVTFYA